MVLRGEQNVKILMRGLLFCNKQQCTTNHAILIPVQLEHECRSAKNNLYNIIGETYEEKRNQ
jgi:hypothetical protein